VAVLVAAGCGLLTGCSGHTGGGASNDARDAVRAAAATTLDTGTSTVDTTVAVVIPGVPTSTLTGTGGYDYASRTGQLTLHVPASVTPSGVLEEILTPAVLYLRPGTPAGARWMSVPADRLADGDLISSGATSPELAFQLLRAAAPGVSYRGKVTVDGGACSHYRGTVTLRQAAADPTTSADDRATLLAAANAFASDTVPFDVYVDAQGRVRRFVGTFSFYTAGSAHRLVSITSQLDLGGFGTPERARVPAPADVQSAQDAPRIEQPTATATATHAGQ
jgi:hypothetical protein